MKKEKVKEGKVAEESKEKERDCRGLEATKGKGR